MQANGSFAHWLRERRRALDLTQAELAAQTCCSIGTVRKIERGERRPSKQIAERLADVLAIALEDRAAFLASARRPPNGRPSTPTIEQTSTKNSFSSKSFNLPTQPMAFVGRIQELARIAAYLDGPQCQLLTLVGIGGVGKTRLAIQTAQQCTKNFAHGVHFVSLAPVNSPDLLAFAIGSALGIVFYGKEPAAVQLVNYLREKSVLLVLDNFEHLLDGTPLLVELVLAAPHLKLLVTSRERLNVPAEWVFQVEGMDYPRDGAIDQIQSSSAIQLFMQSAQRVEASFTLEQNEGHILRICQLVEGMPLGILLAVAWIGVLSVREIAEEIQRSFDILDTDQRAVPERQRSLRAVFDHSWRLLTEQEREVFVKLSVFRGGFTREAAQQVAGASLKTLKSLANKSFVRRDSSAQRYEIHELLRQYGEEQLNASLAEHERIQDLHCEYFVDYVQRQLTPLVLLQRGSGLAEFGLEFSNILAAWSDAVTKRKASVFRRVAQSLWLYCDLRTTKPEISHLFRRAAEALQVAPAEPETEIALGLMLTFQAWFTNTGSSSPALQMKALVDQSLEILRRYDCPGEMALALRCQANISITFLRRYTEGEQAAREGLRIARAHHYFWSECSCLNYLVAIRRAQGDIVQAQQFAEEMLSVGQAYGDLYAMATALKWLARIAIESGDYREAVTCLEQAIEMYKELETEWHLHSAEAYALLGNVALLFHDYGKAKSCFQQSLTFTRQLGRQAMEFYRDLADISRWFAAQSKHEEAAELLSAIQRADNPEVRDLARTRLAELQATLPPDVYAAAVERGKALDLDSVIAEFLEA